MSRFNEEAIVLAIRRGDKVAFQQLYRRYYKALLKAILYIVKNPHEAEDLLQDTYIKIWLRFHYYDSQQGMLYTWLLNVARNTALDALRRRKLTCSPLEGEVETDHDTDNYELATSAIDVKEVVRQRLKPQHWQIIRLAYWGGYTNVEIAKALELPVGTVKTRIKKSLIELRLIFQ